MVSEEQLRRVAADYGRQGLAVVLRPSPSDLPPFAAAFRVDLLGRRQTGGVLVTVKRNQTELATDPDVARYAEVTNAEAGWQFDLVVVEPENARLREIGVARESSAEEIADELARAESISTGGNPRLAVLAAWSATEAAIRLWLRSAGHPTGVNTDPRSLLVELYSTGPLSADEFASTDQALRLRNQIAHGLWPTTGDSSDRYAAVVTELARLTRQLMSESGTPASGEPWRAQAFRFTIGRQPVDPNFLMDADAENGWVDVVRHERLADGSTLLISKTDGPAGSPEPAAIDRLYGPVTRS